MSVVHPPMTKAMAEEVLLLDAQNISAIIRSVDTDNRGTLLRLIAEDLRKNAQGFTAKVFSAASQAYGE